jgi:hypothetical protein
MCPAVEARLIELRLPTTHYLHNRFQKKWDGKTYVIAG